MGPPPPGSPPAPPRSRRGLDRAIGIVLGVVLGVGIVTAFVFLGSEGTIDAPRIDDGNTQSGRREAGQTAVGEEGQGRSQKQKQGAGPGAIPVVTVIGGAPPTSGPPQLDFQQGRMVRFRIRTDAPVGIEIPGYGISETIESDATLSFRANRPGQFPVVVAASHIGIASLRVQR